MDLKEIQRLIDKEMNEHNQRPVPAFEGYSPDEMTQVLYFTLEKESPVKLQRLSDSDYERIPILAQVKYLANLIDKKGELKLTNKGYLPVKVVSELYQQGFLKDKHIESGISKLYKETDSITINLTRILLELAGLTKKRNGKLSLTKLSEKLLSDNPELLRLILLTFATKFNWAYFDGYGENNIGQLGYGFSLILLAKYGHKKRLDSFYATKYFNAYPMLLEEVYPSFGTLERYTNNCYSIRTFDRFLDFFGLIEIDQERKGYDFLKHIKKTDLFDRLIKCKPPKKQIR